MVFLTNGIHIMLFCLMQCNVSSVFVYVSATLAMNVMFHSVPLSKDDTVLCFDIVYPAVRNALAQRCLDTGAHLLKVHSCCSLYEY
jgi:hypothetical protein